MLNMTVLKLILRLSKIENYGGQVHSRQALDLTTTIEKIRVGQSGKLWIEDLLAESRKRRAGRRLVAQREMEHRMNEDVFGMEPLLGEQGEESGSMSGEGVEELSSGVEIVTTGCCWTREKLSLDRDGVHVTSTVCGMPTTHGFAPLRAIKSVALYRKYQIKSSTLAGTLVLVFFFSVFQGYADVSAKAKAEQRDVDPLVTFFFFALLVLGAAISIPWCCGRRLVLGGTETKLFSISHATEEHYQTIKARVGAV